LVFKLAAVSRKQIHQFGYFRAFKLVFRNNKMTHSQQNPQLASASGQLLSIEQLLEQVFGTTLGQGAAATPSAAQPKRKAKELAVPGAIDVTSFSEVKGNERQFGVTLMFQDLDAAKAYLASVREPSAGKLHPLATLDKEKLANSRMSDLSPKEQADAMELWLRDNLEWFNVGRSEGGRHIKFLLDRTSEMRQALMTKRSEQDVEQEFLAADWFASLGEQEKSALGFYLANPQAAAVDMAARGSRTHRPATENK